MRKILVLFVLSTAITITGCKKFLDEKPQTEIDASSYWKNEDDIKTGLAAMYDGLQVTFDNNYTIWGDARTDEVETTIYGDDAYVVNGLSANTTGSDWSPFYKTINRANLLIKYVPVIKSEYVISLDQKVLNYYLSQAYAVRAFNYFWIVRLWGDAPYWNEPFETIGTDPYRERMAANQVLDSITADLERAVALSLNSTGTPNVYEASLGAMYSMLQDVNMWRKNYSKSVEWFTKLDALRTGSARRYDTVSRAQWKLLFTAPNDATNNKESIWSLPWDYIVDGGASVSELIGAGNTNSDFIVDDSVWKYWVATPVDIRGYQSIDLRVPARDKFNKFYLLNANGTTTYPNGSQANILFPLYRLADMYLLRAEAANKLGDQTTALRYLNIIHQRAGLPAYLAADLNSIAKMEDAILEERKLELYMEAKRWFDLVRTDKVIPVMDQYYRDRQLRRGTVPTGFGDPRTILWPINRTVLNSNPKLVQNVPY
ncbi:RagB/SusD family nutrient uptake outer membrane protein [Segetibacter sp. 3557_3]|uniref:RagB/SusD family nutrient uptake outer membrane protein n=1 Tax=Segetibacter sp. 3557_3 TaxID=2547429 RepID=UPI001404380C|nr:RagB/SusD family nutrient uptake outer membrane protein [Segetibacter sp. 3557_3]